MLKIAYHPIFTHQLPLGHRFPMSKYELLHRQLLHEGTCTEANFFEPGMPSRESLLAVHSESYISALQNLTLSKSEVRKLGFPLSAKLVEREHIITQGTIEGCSYAIDNGIAMNIAGGTHHAYPDHGEAFCLFHDQAIAARQLQKLGKVKKILFVDLDVHQGNGTAVIFEKDPSVFTFSMHGAGNYPFRKEKSNLDIAVPDGTGDDVFLSELKKTLPRLIEQQNPDFIFYLSGVDILETDKLGRLTCSIEGCTERDRFVLTTCKEAGIPVQVSMGGGYSPDIKTILEAHANTYRMAQEIYF
ncbi:histone deacetylase family protein [Cochleicola gelatinilyticus]|uniref:Deacetylase n=1 Tax=Cochleicola gelatinilyticus TaxID=1763537 RepID=A0A167J759_9FLAO|nr:histone deacetylase [Cochleicola gelatinilyticus]OAB80390.1 deacetylase [Cochleicola gelatinilyticus]